jgi:hypothetical protein
MFVTFLCPESLKVCANRLLKRIAEDVRNAIEAKQAPKHVEPDSGGQYLTFIHID